MALTKTGPKRGKPYPQTVLHMSPTISNAQLRQEESEDQTAFRADMAKYEKYMRNKRR